jgi:hypothetical protein
MGQPVTGLTKQMKLWKKALVLNIAGLLGIASSIFVVPPNTPFFLWLIISAVVLSAFNVAIFVRHRKAGPGSRQPTSKTTDAIIALGVVFWIVDVLVHILRR